MRHIQIILALALGVLTHLSWADVDSSTPLAPGKLDAGNRKQIAGNFDAHQVYKPRKSKESHKEAVSKRKSNPKLPIVSLQQSQRIAQCLKTTTAQIPACIRIQEGFLRHEIAMEEAAANANISPALVKAIAGIESHYNEKAKSKMGAVGLMQLMPQTAISLGLNKHSMSDPDSNLNAGAMHLRNLLDQFTDLEMAIAAYLLGANAFQKQIPTKATGYVQNTLALYRYFESANRPVGVNLEAIE